MTSELETGFCSMPGTRASREKRVLTALHSHSQTYAGLTGGPSAKRKAKAAKQGQAAQGKPGGPGGPGDVAEKSSAGAVEAGGRAGGAAGRRKRRGPRVEVRRHFQAWA